MKNKNKEAIEKALAFAYEATTKDYCYKWFDKTDHMCPICHPETEVKGFNCINFVCACFGHGAGDARSLKNCRRLGGRAYGGETYLTHINLFLWKLHNGGDWIMIGSGRKNGEHLDTSLLKPGDVLLGYLENGKYKHMMLYVGNEQLIDCTPYNETGGDISVVPFSNRTERYRITRAFRYTGEGDL